MGVQAGDDKGELHVATAMGEDELSPLVPQPFVRLQDCSEARRVEKLQAVHLQHRRRGSVGQDPLHRGFEDRHGLDVKLTRQAQRHEPLRRHAAFAFEPTPHGTGPTTLSTSIARSSRGSPAWKATTAFSSVEAISSAPRPSHGWGCSPAAARPVYLARAVSDPASTPLPEMPPIASAHAPSPTPKTS